MSIPQPRYRTKGVRRRWVRTPGGRSTVHYKRKKPNPPSCGICGRPLSGIPRVAASKLKALAKSSRRPNRPYGGNLCPSCSRAVLKTRVRAG